jgi:ferredoxin-type protein NapF
MADKVDQRRRAFLTGGRRLPAPIRPPWAAAHFAEACIRCSACLEACPEQILTRDGDGFPAVDFAAGSGECTFCRRCAEACPVPAFDLEAEVPWHLTAKVGEACLARRGVHCQSCGDACEPRAIRFTLQIGGPPVPEIDQASCTGCGACLSTCPADAIVMQRDVPAHA